MDKWVCDFRNELNGRLTIPEQKINSYLKKKKIVFELNYPFELKEYKRSNICFVDFLINEKVVLEIDGKHHRTDEKSFEDDKKKRNGLYQEYCIPTIRIPNELVKGDFVHLQRFLDMLIDILSLPQKKWNRIKKNIFQKQDWNEVENYIQFRYGENNRLKNRSFIETINQTENVFMNYRKIMFCLTNGITGHFWKEDNYDLNFCVGDYVKFSQADKPGKYHLKKLPKVEYKN